jgi:hypothetical protein
MSDLTCHRTKTFHETFWYDGTEKNRNRADSGLSYVKCELV